MSQIVKKFSDPLLIVLTPVRNEAWILRAFLTATSLWADKIIIADQKSTDGSREMCAEFSKVILIENDEPDINMGKVRCQLMDEARKIEGEKILITLDADEFWSGDFINTDTWRQILRSKPDDVFEFKWMNVRPDLCHYILEPQKQYYNWVTHASDDLFIGTYPTNRFIHEWRLKWSNKTTREKEFSVDEIRAIHFCYANQKRLLNKWKFYAVSCVAVPNDKYNMVNLYRQYHTGEEKKQGVLIPKDAFAYYEHHGVDILRLIDFDDIGQYYLDKIAEYIHRDGARKYAILDIWDEEFCKAIHVEDPRNIWQKCVHHYLRLSTDLFNGKKQSVGSMFVRIIDKCLKKIM